MRLLREMEKQGMTNKEIEAHINIIRELTSSNISPDLPDDINTAYMIVWNLLVRKKAENA